MQSAVVLFAVLAVAAANSIHYAAVPQLGYGNTVVNSQRLGGNFAYSVQQPGYAGLNYGYGSPVVYSAGVPAASTLQTVGVKAPVTTQYYTTGKVASPVTYQVPASTVVAGTPAGTYKTVSGVSPVVYSSGLGYSGLGYNGVSYGLTGYPTGYTGLSGLNGYTTVY
jgi:hypothetical protein